MQTHIKIVGWLWIINGIVSILLVIPGLIITNVTTPNPQDVLFVTIGALCFFIPGIIADFAAGYGVLQYRNWGRILAIILGILNILFFCYLILPLALGIYTLVIMFNDETKTYFSSGGAPAEMEPVN